MQEERIYFFIKARIATININIVNMIYNSSKLVIKHPLLSQDSKREFPLQRLSAKY